MCKYRFEPTLIAPTPCLAVRGFPIRWQCRIKPTVRVESLWVREQGLVFEHGVNIAVDYGALGNVITVEIIILGALMRNAWTVRVSDVDLFRGYH